jgi:4-aminobutyrate aminotransferase-like enzyme
MSSSAHFNTKPTQVEKISTKYRSIQTAIPSPGTEAILQKLSQYESRSMHGQLPLIWEKAEDFSVYDNFSNKWIDFTSTIFVANVGHSNPRVIQAIESSIRKPMLACYAYPNEVRATYLEKLISFAGKNFDKAFLLSAGTETTEAAMKLMKMHGRKMGKRKNLVVGITGNWHGRTLGAQVLSSNQNQKDWISNPDSEVIHIDFPYPESLDCPPQEFLQRSLESLRSCKVDFEVDVCGFMLETFQGWGAYFYPNEYVQELRRLCDEFGILLAFDEMQSGFGRTGKNFGYEHYKVKADLICCGKGMGGGLPISGVIGPKEIMDLPEIGNMSSTHSGNPLMCAVGSAVLDELVDRNLVQEAERRGEILKTKLLGLQADFPNLIKLINCKGLIAAVIFSNQVSSFQTSRFVSLVVEKCFQSGLLVVHTGRESIKIGPPLTITDDALIEGIEVLRESLSKVSL